MELSEKQKIGRQAELKACEFLQAKGFKLLQTNYTCYHGEIDLIMQDGAQLVFVEVRMRHDTLYGSALETITYSKVKKLTKAALHFLQKKRWLYRYSSRFDVVAIHHDTNQWQIEWIKNAFSADH